MLDGKNQKTLRNASSPKKIGEDEQMPEDEKDESREEVVIPSEKRQA